MNILITGGASGLGEAITRKLASNSDDMVFFTFYKSNGKAKVIENEHHNAKGLQCDFQNQSEIDALLKFIETTEINVLINNAYISDISPKHFHKVDFSVFIENFNLNIIPIIRITQKAILNFRKLKFGKIITILSSAIIDKPPIGWSEYVAGKAYLASLSKSWAIENSPYNITSNTISPSFMQTALTSDIDERLIRDMVDNHPYKQLLTTNEVSEAILFLSKCSQQINGVNLIINAGTHVI
jgi:3-oxoacyl-[acyl-carrier protein] reductase